MRYAELPETRWRNGAGTTRQIATVPANASTDSFTWRLSIASILVAGPFSSYPGVDRVLLNCGPGPLALEVNGAQTLLLRHEHLSFDGEDAVSASPPQEASLPQGPTLDLNLMTRRLSCRGSLELLHLDGPISDDAPGLQAFVVLQGRAVVDGRKLDALDTVFPSGSGDGIGFENALVAAITVTALADDDAAAPHPGD